MSPGLKVSAHISKAHNAGFSIFSKLITNMGPCGGLFEERRVLLLLLLLLLVLAVAVGAVDLERVAASLLVRL